MYVKHFIEKQLRVLCLVKLICFTFLSQYVKCFMCERERVCETRSAVALVTVVFLRSVS